MLSLRYATVMFFLSSTSKVSIVAPEKGERAWNLKTNAANKTLFGIRLYVCTNIFFCNMASQIRLEACGWRESSGRHMHGSDGSTCAAPHARTSAARCLHRRQSKCSSETCHHRGPSATQAPGSRNCEQPRDTAFAAEASKKRLPAPRLTIASREPGEPSQTFLARTWLSRCAP